MIAEITSHLFKGRLEVWATDLGDVESDIRYALLESRLRYIENLEDRASREVTLGTLTLPREQVDLAGPVMLAATPIGESVSRQENNSLLAAEVAEQPGERVLVLIYYARDVQWGLTEYFAIPITLSGARLTQGARVQIGRDAMIPPRYFGTIYLESDTRRGRLTIARRGEGSFSRTTVLVDNGAGAFYPEVEN